MPDMEVQNLNELLQIRRDKLKELQDAGRETGGGSADCAAGQPGSGAVSDEMQKRGSPAREKPPEKKDGTHIVPEDPLKGTGP